MWQHITIRTENHWPSFTSVQLNCSLASVHLYFEYWRSGLGLILIAMHTKKRIVQHKLVSRNIAFDYKRGKINSVNHRQFTSCFVLAIGHKDNAGNFQLSTLSGLDMQ